MREEIVDVVVTTLRRLAHANETEDADGFELALADLLGLERTLREYDESERRQRAEQLDEALLREQSRIEYDKGQEPEK